MPKTAPGFQSCWGHARVVERRPRVYGPSGDPGNIRARSGAGIRLHRRKPGTSTAAATSTSVTPTGRSTASLIDGTQGPHRPNSEGRLGSRTGVGTTGTGGTRRGSTQTSDVSHEEVFVMGLSELYPGISRTGSPRHWWGYRRAETIF